MAYASISEAWGDDFARRLNPSTSITEGRGALVWEGYENQFNPTRNNDTLKLDRSTNNNRKKALVRSLQDKKAQKESFSDVSAIRNTLQLSEFNASGDDDPHYQVPPDQYLRQTVRNVKYNRSTPILKPMDYDENDYLSFYNNEDSKCRDYFYHLDTCRKCQKKLKKRVIRYFRALQASQRNPLLPGVQGMTPSMDRELFSDYDQMDELMALETQKPLAKEEEKKEEKKEVKEEVKEDFTIQDLGHDFTPGVFLILFGLFVIYSLDLSGKISKTGGLKIIK